MLDDVFTNVAQLQCTQQHNNTTRIKVSTKFHETQFFHVESMFEVKIFRNTKIYAGFTLLNYDITIYEYTIHI